MFNKVILVGNLTRDLELRYLPSGSAVCNTAIATNRRFKSQTGEQKEEVCFIDIAFFGRTAEIANQYLKKGSKVLVEGRLKLEQWNDQSGQKRSRHTITVENLEMLDPKNQPLSENGNYNDYSQQNHNQSQGFNQNNTQSNNVPNIDVSQNNGYNQRPNNQTNAYGQKPNANNNSIPEIDINDDEIPF